MNYKMMGRFIAQILGIEVIFMIPATLYQYLLSRKRGNPWIFLSMVMIALLALGLHALCRKGKKRFYAREGMVCVGLSWIVMSLMGALPFYISREIPKYIDCFFEIVSGFTTTGFPSCQRWRVYRRVFYIGEASATGWVEWEFWYFYWQFLP
ncbi:MAG: hypothetical protein V8T31_08840 [Lachnospiraceae bacterium]